MKKAVLILCVSLVYFAKAQDACFFDPNWNYFYVFDNEELEKMEFLPVLDSSFGQDYICYVRNNGRFIIHSNGVTTDKNIVRPKYYAKDYQLVYFIDQQLHVFKDNQSKMVEKWAVDNIAVGDNIVAFSNSFNRFLVYFEDSLYAIEQWDINEAKAGDNIIAYLDQNNLFKVFYYGDRIIIDNIPPSIYKVSKDVVAFVDYLGDFKVWDRGEVTTLLNQQPSWFECGEEFVAFIDPQDQLSVYYKGEIIQLLTYKPKYLKVNENVMVYTDDFGAIWAFYKGETIRICSYTPNDMELGIDNDVVVYKDNYGYLKGILYGKLHDFSKERALSFEVFNQTVVYRPDKVKWVVSSDGKYYNYP